jgi:hypothetical protein
MPLDVAAPRALEPTATGLAMPRGALHHHRGVPHPQAATYYEEYSKCRDAAASFLLRGRLNVTDCL